MANVCQRFLAIAMVTAEPGQSLAAIHLITLAIPCRWRPRVGGVAEEMNAPSAFLLLLRNIDTAHFLISNPCLTLPTE